MDGSLKFIENGLNFTVSGVTEQIPHVVMFGEQNNHLFNDLINYPPTKLNHDKVLELVRIKMKSKIERRKEKFDRLHNTEEYQIGDKV